MFADLHIHSNFSDGSDDCRDILTQAAAHEVSLVSVTDHNDLRSMAALDGLNGTFPKVRVLNGVELDAKYNGCVYHILGYGITDHPSLHYICDHNRTMQENFNDSLLETLAGTDERIGPGEYRAYRQPAHRGGWKLLNYLYDKGVTESLTAGRRLYWQNGFYARDVDFVSVREACRAIRTSGGVPVLAHPVKNIPHSHRRNPSAFFQGIESLAGEGVKGVECVYPLHSASLEGDLIQFCRDRGLCITGGTDYHDSFFDRQKQKIGGQFVRMSLLDQLLAALGQPWPPNVCCKAGEGAVVSATKRIKRWRKPSFSSVLFFA